MAEPEAEGVFDDVVDPEVEDDCERERVTLTEVEGEPETRGDFDTVDVAEPVDDAVALPACSLR